MQMTEQDFAEHYAHLTDGELAKIASGRRNLVPAAKTSLDAEMGRRGLTQENVKQFRNYRSHEHIEVDPLVRKVQGKVRRSKLLDKVNELRKMPRMGWRVILLGIICSFIFAMIFDHFGVFDEFMPVAGSLMVLGFTLKCHWDLKGKVWFWATIGTWAALHIWMIIRVHWPSGWVPAKVLEGWATIDLVVLFVVIALIEKMLHEGRFAPKGRAT